MVGREGNGMPFNSTKLRLGKSVWPIGEQTGIVGILNVTPDSFSDGGEYLDIELAVSRGKEIADQGADGLDMRRSVPERKSHVWFPLLALCRLRSPSHRFLSIRPSRRLLEPP